MSTSKTSTSSAALAASERSGEAANAAGAELPAPRPLVPDSEVVARPHRRRFSAEYKLSIIDQADSSQGAGAVGTLLRREGLYSSHLATWRQQRKQGEFDALTAKKRGPKVVVSPLVKEEPGTAEPQMPLDEEAEKRRVDHRGSKKSGCVVGQPDSEYPDRRGELMSAALELGQSVGQAVACRALGVPRATLYRHMQPAAPPRARPRRSGLSLRLNATSCSIICTRSDSATRLQWRSMPPCWTRTSISARSAPCIASWPRTGS